MRDGGRKIQLSKAIQYNSIIINQVHFVSKELRFVVEGWGDKQKESLTSNYLQYSLEES